MIEIDDVPVGPRGAEKAVAFRCKGDEQKGSPHDSGRPSRFGQIGQTMLDRATRGVRSPLWWAHQDSNLEPRDYESPALTVEL